MKLIDLHCDTLYKLLDEKKNHVDLMSNDYAISIPGMKKAGTIAQFFACFTCLEELERGYEEGYETVMTMIAKLEEQCAKYADDIVIARSKEDLLKNEQKNKISAFLTVEEGGILEDDMERLEKLYNKGVRLLTPMWNYENCLGHPNSSDTKKMQLGLKPFGFEVVERCGELGIIVDVSHASDQSFWDILHHAKGPVVASHSNCRELCGHQRNMTNDMIHALSEHGGVAGLNLYGAFLDGSDQSTLDAMEAQIKHMLRYGGEDFPAIGTDFDGFDGMSREDIPTVGEFDRLWHQLNRSGIPERILEKIWCHNALNVIM